jgi:hypothetical protein
MNLMSPSSGNLHNISEGSWSQIEIINILNEPDAFIFSEFIYYFRRFIVSHMITNVSNRYDDSTFREFTECFKGSMEEMQNISSLTGN